MVDAEVFLLPNWQTPEECLAYTNNTGSPCWQSSWALPFSSGCPSLPVTFRPSAETLLILLGILLDWGPPSNKLKLIWNKIHTHTHTPSKNTCLHTNTHTHHRPLLKIHVFNEEQLTLFSILARMMLSFKGQRAVSFYLGFYCQAHQ